MLPVAVVQSDPWSVQDAMMQATLSVGTTLEVQCQPDIAAQEAVVAEAVVALPVMLGTLHKPMV